MKQTEELLIKLRYKLTTERNPNPLVEVQSIVSGGCQLHGDPIRVVRFKVIESGYGYKKNCNYEMELDNFKMRTGMTT